MQKKSEGEKGESQTKGDLNDLADLSGPGSVDVKREIGAKRLVMLQV